MQPEIWALHGHLSIADWKNMVYKRFRIQCLIRVLVLTATVFLFLILLLNKALYATTILVGALVVVQIYSLIRFVEKTNRNLTRFLESIRHGDFSKLFTDKVYGSSSFIIRSFLLRSHW